MCWIEKNMQAFAKTYVSYNLLLYYPPCDVILLLMSMMMMMLVDVIVSNRINLFTLFKMKQFFRSQCSILLIPFSNHSLITILCPIYIIFRLLIQDYYSLLIITISIIKPKVMSINIVDSARWVPNP
jgi:hypothetical protein